MSLELCHPTSPRRAVDWRWRCPAYLRNRLLPVPRGWMDAWVERAITFQEALDDCDGDPHHPRLAEQDPVLAAAHGLQLDGDGPTRWHVEALLLAGEGDDSIAERTHIPADVIAAYASVFFDVRARLAQRSYILHQAINVNHDRPEHEVGRAWKLLGYGGGPLVVDFLAEGAGRMDDWGMIGPAAPQDRHARLRRMIAAALTLDLDAVSARRLDPLIGSLEEVDERVSAATNVPIATSFAAMVEGLVLTPSRTYHDDDMAVRIESRPFGADPGRVPAHEGRADLGEAAPLRRVGS